jgi:hypothetical protein
MTEKATPANCWICWFKHVGRELRKIRVLTILSSSKKIFEELKKDNYLKDYGNKSKLEENLLK